MRKPAIPVSFLDPRGERSGAVFIGTSSTEAPLRVHEQQLGDDPSRTCIVLEFENILGMSGREVLSGFGIEKDVDEQIRLALHPADARKLCHHLITALAGTGDTVAGMIHEKMVEAMSEARRNHHLRKVLEDIDRRISSVQVKLRSETFVDRAPGDDVANYRALESDLRQQRSAILSALGEEHDDF